MVQEELRIRINALVSMQRIGKLLSCVQKEIDNVLQLNNYVDRDYDDDTTKHVSVKENFHKFCKYIFSMLGSDVYEEALSAFSEYISDTKNTYNLLAVPVIVAEEKVFRDTFDKVKDKLEIGSLEDDFAIWIKTLSDIINSQAIEDIPVSDICPICGNIPDKVPADIVFGCVDIVPRFIYRCECGAYAFSARTGEMVGALAQKSTHVQRDRVRSSISMITELCGITELEAYLYLSRTVNLRIYNSQDIEKLNEECCSKVIHACMELKSKYQAQDIKWPQKHNELMSFLHVGGRLRAIKCLDANWNNRLFVPISVSEGGSIIVKGYSGSEKLLLPNVLKMKFDKDLLEIKHPNKKEYYRIYPKFTF